MREPDWKFYQDLRDVPIWWACALSLGLDPEAIEYDHHADHYFFRVPVSARTREKFRKRLLILESHFGHRPRPLADVVKLAVNVLGWEVPDELMPLAKEVPTTPIEAPGEVPAAPVGEASSEPPKLLATEVPAATTQAETAQPSTPDPPTTDTSTEPSKRPLPQQRFQEEEILRVLRELRFDAQALPKAPPGKPGVKAAVKKALGYSNSAFEKAWERCLKQGAIKYAT